MHPMRHDSAAVHVSGPPFDDAARSIAARSLLSVGALAPVLCNERLSLQYVN